MRDEFVICIIDLMVAIAGMICLAFGTYTVVAGFLYVMPAFTESIRQLLSVDKVNTKTEIARIIIFAVCVLAIFTNFAYGIGKRNIPLDLLRSLLMIYPLQTGMKTIIIYLKIWREK